MSKRPDAKSSLGNEELDKAEKQFETFDENIKSMTLDRMNTAPKLDQEAQTKISNRDIDKMKEIYLKPDKSISCNQKFNENFREEWNFKKEYVQFIAENKEIIGETIEMWTRPYGGLPAEFWKVPTNKPVWGPRYLAEQIKGCSYHRLKMEEARTSGSDQMGQYYGGMVVDNIIQRLDATPVNSRRSIFMGASGF